MLQLRTAPYFIIGLFTIAISCLRASVHPEFSWGAHALVGLMQLLSLICVWKLVQTINSVLDRYIPFAQGPLARVLLQIAITMLILGPIMIAVAVLCKPYYPSYVSKQFIGIAVILFVVVIVLFNFGFYAFHFFSNWQNSIEDNAKLEIQAADLEREKFNLQYHQLRNQVNPHYLFNTLTSLDGLIHTDPELASQFVRHMSKVYRYVLQHKESEVVSLDEELEFIGHYIELLQIRYAGGLNIVHDISEEARDKGIVMVTLQMVLDNAIKHNVVQASAPLNISMEDEGRYLVIRNNKQLRKQIESSNGQGVQQLRQLYGYLTNLPVIVDDNEHYYLIKIPLI
ncbi:MAG: hypothetical protein EOP56_08435 [Sphingobacteriales bacterium]|nr:MAG: hypothetical protein EOP56_08435 [Sphingobacteriales bacterium]